MILIKIRIKKIREIRENDSRVQVRTLNQESGNFPTSVTHTLDFLFEPPAQQL